MPMSKKKLTTSVHARPELIPSEAGTIEAGVKFYSLGKFSDALALMEKFLRQYPTHPDALNIAAASALSSGKLAAAEIYWVKAIKSDPDFADAHFNLGHLFRETNRRAEAEAS